MAVVLRQVIRAGAEVIRASALLAVHLGNPQRMAAAVDKAAVPHLTVNPENLAKKVQPAPMEAAVVNLVQLL